RCAGTVAADEAEQAMLDRVPFRTPSWVVTDRDLEPEPIAHHRLESLLPQPGAGTVAAAGVGQDQQFVGIGKGRPSLLVPPAGDRIDGEGRRICRRPDMDGAAIVEHIVDAVWNGTALAVLKEVVDVDGNRRAAPSPPSLFEVADQFAG